MPALHLFADPDATWGKALCGEYVKHRDDGRVSTLWHCPECQDESRKRARRDERVRDHHERIAED